jgi:signal transduction histidine kinase
MPNAPTTPAPLDQELDRLQRLASLGTITAILAHEVNNVLTPILSHAQFALQDMEDTDRLIAAAGRAAAGAKQAAQIIDGVLRLAKGEPANETPHADVQDAAETALSCLARDPSKDGIRVKVIAPDEPVYAAIAPTWLLQAILNIVLNARNAMAGKGGSLTISVGCSTWNTADDRVTIEISDSGPGMSSDTLARLFEPFVRGCDGDEKRPAYKGVGLGLAVTRQILEAAGGSIEVTSQIGEGTTFALTLPKSKQIANKSAA